MSEATCGLRSRGSRRISLRISWLPVSAIPRCCEQALAKSSALMRRMARSRKSTKRIGCAPQRQHGCSTSGRHRRPACRRGVPCAMSRSTRPNFELVIPLACRHVASSADLTPRYRGRPRHVLRPSDAIVGDLPVRRTVGVMARSCRWFAVGWTASTFASRPPSASVRNSTGSGDLGRDRPDTSARRWRHAAGQADRSRNAATQDASVLPASCDGELIVPASICEDRADRRAITR